MTLPTVAMDALMTITALTYDDLAEITDILTRLFSAEGQVLDLNQQLGAAQGEVAALTGVLEFERERTRELPQERGSLVQGSHCNSARLVRQAAPRLRVMTGNWVHVRLRSVRRPIKDPRRKRRGISEESSWQFSRRFWYSWPCFLA